jgi:hypothetical protein
MPPEAEVRREGTIYLAGRWRASDEALFPDGTGPREMRLKWSGVDAGVVLTLPPSAAGVRVQVTLDGNPVPAAARGRDVQADASGATSVLLDTPRSTASSPGSPFGVHEIALAPGRRHRRVRVLFRGARRARGVDRHR